MVKPKLFFMINSLHKGGAERVISTLSNRFYARDFTVFIVCLNYSAQGYPIAEGVKIVYLLNRITRSDAFLMRIFYALATYVRLLILLIKERPGCVIAFMTTSNLWAGLSCGLLGIQYIVSERITPDLTIKKFGAPLRWLSSFVFRNAKAVVSPAKGVEDCLRDIKGFENLSNYKVINNPINTIDSDVKFSQKALHHKPYILAVGRLTHQKGFDYLIESFSNISDLNIDLLIIGQGREEQNLKEQIVRHSLSNRVFLMGVRDDLSAYYTQADVFVLSSRNEGYPNALIEAMSMGCPCVAMDCKFGPSEIIHQRENGILVEHYDPIELANVLRELINDPCLRKKLSENAKQINKTNSLDVVLDKWEELIHRD